jgi:O-antigen ligase
VAVHPTDLEPSLVSYRTYVTRRRIGRVDAAAVFWFMICLLTLIPSQLILPGTSDIGRPAVVVCVLMWCWWVAARLNPRLTMVGPQPIRWAVLLFLLSELISYAIGYLRGLTAMEANAADRSVLSTLAFIGVILMAADGVSNWDRLTVVLRVFVWCSAYMGVIAVLQATLSTNIVQYMTIPGLQSRGVIPFEVRGGGVRVPATTTHYLELASTLALALPFAIHFIRFAPTAKQRRRFVLATVLIIAGIACTISRTGIVAIALGLLVLTPLWPWRLRYNVLVSAIAMFGALAAIKPSMARTFYDIFAGASNDPSVTSRTDRYALVGFFYNQRPWFGRGSGTWVPPMYQYLDNQWLVTALTQGLIGCFVMGILHITAIVLASIALKRATSPADRHLCLVLVALQLIAIFVAVTFDSLSFTTYAMMLALVTGLCGTVWRFTHPTRTVRTSTPRWHSE